MEIKLSKFRYGAKSAYSFVFDDGCYISSTEKTIDVFKKAEQKTGIKIKATSAQTVNFIKKDDVKGFWDKAIKDGWYDISSHSMDHTFCYNENTPYEKRYEDAKNAQIELRKMYPNEKIITFVIPNGEDTKEGREVLKEFYYACRCGHDYINDIDNLDWFDVGVLTAKLEYKTAKPYTDHIDKVIEKGGWSVQLNHWLSDKDDDAFHAQRADTFEPECMYLCEKAKKNEIWIASFNEAVLYFKEYLASTLEIVEDDGYYNVKLNCPLDKKIFDFPLTLEIKTSSDVSVFDGKATKIALQNTGISYVEILPNQTLKIK